MDTLITIVVAVVSGSIGGVIISYFLSQRSKRFEANFDRKLGRYFNISTMTELYLYTEESRYSVLISGWNPLTTSIKENKERAWNDLMVNRRQLFFITKNIKVINAYDAFLENANQNNYEKLLVAMKEDIWGK